MDFSYVDYDSLKELFKKLEPELLASTYNFANLELSINK